jgi:hypothetical protein
VLSRGDRRLGRVIYDAWKMGAKFDAWDECFDEERWRHAFASSGLEAGFYARRERPLDEHLPWAHIDVGVSSEFLKREYQRAKEGRETPDCRTQACHACGLERLNKDCRQRLGAT